MIKQTEQHRAVTETDLQVVEGAIAYTETLLKNLYVQRRMLGEVGNLDRLYAGLKQGIEQVQAEATRTSSQLEQVKADLAKVQSEEVATRQRLATLTAEAAEKQRELSAYSEAIDRITGKAAA